jgi:hypothetical protein
MRRLFKHVSNVWRKLDGFEYLNVYEPGGGCACRTCTLCDRHHLHYNLFKLDEGEWSYELPSLYGWQRDRIDFEHNLHRLRPYDRSSALLCCPSPICSTEFCPVDEYMYVSGRFGGFAADQYGLGK